MAASVLFIESLFLMLLVYIIISAIFRTKKIYIFLPLLLIPISASILLFMGYSGIPNNEVFYIKDTVFVILSVWILLLITKIIKEEKIWTTIL